jgi:surfeit locus 1 family protein
VPTVVFLLVLPVLIALGFWQLDRAAQKEKLQRQYDTRSAQPPVMLGSKPVDREFMRFRPVEAFGRYDYAREFLVDNRVLDRRVGYHVITPLRIKNTDTLLLVNRGWVPGNPDRTILPNTDGPNEVVRISGTAVVPHDKVFQLASEMPIGKQWPRVWQTVNINRFESAVNERVQPVVVLLDPDSKAGGFERKWKRLDTGIAVHQGYAFQWFSLAVALAAIFFLVNFRKPEQQEDKTSGTS